MKKMLLLVAVICPCFVFAQIGIKAGLNFANVSNASSINNKNKSGFHVGLLLAPPSKSIISSRTELIFSKQGYDYKNGVNTGEVNLNYIQLSQMMSINITKYFSLMFGAQTAYLISGNVDSSTSTGNAMADKMMSLYNRMDYGYALGAEVHPFKGILIGARYNVSLNKLYKSFTTGDSPSFSSEDAKNNVVQLFLGWRFGKTDDKSKKKKENQNQ